MLAHFLRFKMLRRLSFEKNDLAGQILYRSPKPVKNGVLVYTGGWSLDTDSQ